MLYPKPCYNKPSYKEVEVYCITKTCLYNFDPLKPHFYIVKLGFTGVYIICPISAQNIDCGYLLEPPYRGVSNEYPQSMFWAEIRKISDFFIWKFSFFLVVKFSIYLNRRVFIMGYYIIYLWSKGPNETLCMHRMMPIYSFCACSKALFSLGWQILP